MSQEFSWKSLLEDARKLKIRRAINMSGLLSPSAVGNKDYKAKHGFKTKQEVEKSIGEKFDRQVANTLAQRERTRATKKR